LPRSESPSGDTGAGLDTGFHVRVLGDRLGGHTHLCPDVVGLFLALHILFLPHIRDLTQLVDHEYSRNRYIGQQVREPIKEKREEPTPSAEGWGVNGLGGQCSKRGGNKKAVVCSMHLRLFL